MCRVGQLPRKCHPSGLAHGTPSPLALVTTRLRTVEVGQFEMVPDREEHVGWSQVPMHIT